jgi:hypothetical protein
MGIGSISITVRGSQFIAVTRCCVAIVVMVHEVGVACWWCSEYRNNKKKKDRVQVHPVTYLHRSSGISCNMAVVAMCCGHSSLATSVVVVVVVQQ